MFRPVPFFIGLRYTRAKRRNHFISFISLASMLGIALGVTVLITVLSVMNGFHQEIRERIFAMAQQVSVNSYSPSGIHDWNKLMQNIRKYSQVVDVAPNIQGQAMLANQGFVQPVLITGIIPDMEKSVSEIHTKVIDGSFDKLQAGEFGIVIGDELAASLRLSKGEKVNVIIPEASVSPLGVMPRYKRFTVVGIFHVGGGFKYDGTAAFIHLNDAQRLYKLDDAVSSLRVKVTDLYAAPAVSSALTSGINQELYYVTNWTQEFGSFFKMVQLEKTMMFIILMLIIAIAAFNLVSSLVMVVTDKRSEIAILRTLGASPRDIMAIFMVQGSVIGIIGTLMGLIGGILLAMNVTFLVEKLQQLLQTKLISDTVYFVDYLPSKIEWDDVSKIIVFALVMSFIATIYPAWQAARIHPAEALRYE